MRTASLAALLAPLLACTVGAAKGSALSTPPDPVLSMANLVDSVKAAVINVEVTSRVGGGPSFRSEGDSLDDFWNRFFGHRGPGQPDQLRQGIGSGFIIGPQGTALTNNHVVEGAESIRVKLEDGRTFDAQIMGRDPLTDVALIRLEENPKNLPAVRLGDSDALRVGEWVVAIGNPFGLTSSVSAGIISARARNIGAGPYDEFLQTDAAINPGNSGGPMFNLRGEVVGMNTAIVGGANIGFAVPSNLIKALLPQLEKEGTVTRGWLGVSVQDFTPELARALGVPAASGALVSEVTDRSPAKAAGLKTDDVIVTIDGEGVTSSSDLTRKVALKRPGSVSTLVFYRGGNREERRVTLGTRPDLEGVGLEELRRGPGENGRQERLGLVVEDIEPGLMAKRDLPRGALIARVTPGSPANSADLRPGMVVIEAGGRPVRSAADLQKVLRDAKPGSIVLLRVHLGEGRLLRALTIP